MTNLLKREEIHYPMIRALLLLSTSAVKIYNTKRDDVGKSRITDQVKRAMRPLKDVRRYFISALLQGFARTGMIPQFISRLFSLSIVSSLSPRTCARTGDQREARLAGAASFLHHHLQGGEGVG